LNVAKSVQHKIVRQYGDTVSYNGETYYLFPSQEKIAKARINELKQCGLSQNKAEYIIDVAKKMLTGEIDVKKIEENDNIAENIELLTRFRGIGKWTAEYALIRGLGKLNAVPAGDLGLQRSISHYYYKDKKITEKDVRKLSEGWGKWQGLATFYLLSADRLKLKI